MKKKVFSLILVGILTVMLAACGSEKIGSGKTIVKSEASIVSYDKNQLVRDATTIIAGEVIGSEVQNDFSGFPATDYKIKVNKVFKGNPAAEVEIRTKGGENDKMKYILDEDAVVTFQLGEKVVLFLTDDKGNRPDKNDFGYFVVGQFQGKFIEQNGKFKNKKLTFDVVDFEQEIKQIEEQNKVNGLKPMKAEGESDI